jgi:type II secretory pathway component PulK
MIVARAKKPSRGMTVVAVLVCLVIVTLISGAILKASAARRVLTINQEHRLQAEWLAESGAQRAVARLARERDYTGETWSLGLDDLGQSQRADPANGSTGSASSDKTAARITITVERLPAEANRRRVHIQADYPLDEPRRARHSKEIMIDLEPSKAGATP